MASTGKRTSRRAQGRPHVETAVGREALLAAARDVLRKKPPGEISLNEVAAAAGVDPKLNRYYFGQLSDLLAAVAVDITRELRARLASLIAEKGTVRHRLRMRVAAFIAVFRENPYYHRLVIDCLYAKDDLAREATSKLFRQSIEELKELIEETADATVIDARFLHITMAAMCEFLFSATPVFAAVFAEQAKDPRFSDLYCDFITDMIMARLHEAGQRKQAKGGRGGARKPPAPKARAG